MKYKLIIDKNAEEEIVATVHAPSSLTEQIENLVFGFSGADGIMGYRDEEMRKLPFGEIECITVLNRKVTAIDKDRNFYRIGDRLRDLENVLPSYFIRINKSTIANRNFIEKFTVSYSGGVDAVFKSGYKDYVSRRCFAKLKKEVLK